MKKAVFLSIAFIFCAMQSKAHDHDFEIQKIDSVEYFISKEKANIQKRKLEQITDLEQVKKMLKGRVIWSKYDEKMGECSEDKPPIAMVSKIMCRNGKTYSFDDGYGWSITAYYPQVDILVGDGDDCSDESFNLTTGATTEDVGNPACYVFSPSGKHLLNGYYNNAAGWVYYFIQEKIDGQYQTIVSLDGEFLEKIDFQLNDVCTMLDAFWENDTTLHVSTQRPLFDENVFTGNYEKLYYRIVLK